MMGDRESPSSTPDFLTSSLFTAQLLYDYTHTPQLPNQTHTCPTNPTSAQPIPHLYCQSHTCPTNPTPVQQFHTTANPTPVEPIPFLYSQSHTCTTNPTPV
ncbi:hypothetical protein E2C01_019196 [Portunus trituberculatus]|uniref:Uncharacterized protein n=1 Tax=Portunus trituberculatus TaxID=210409 RepID=A0A5B7DYJ0_PORTR|nr:hypothetical protein [Portunus trituberculatus]